MRVFVTWCKFTGTYLTKNHKALKTKEQYKFLKEKGDKKQLREINSKKSDRSAYKLTRR